MAQEEEEAQPRPRGKNYAWAAVFGGCLLTILMLAVAGRVSYGPDFFDDFMEGVTESISGGSFGHGRSQVSRVKADMRSMATAIEAYYVDNNIYPAMRPFSTLPNDPAYLASIHAATLSMPEPGTRKMMGLTTPVAYITNLFGDPFTGSPRRRFYYDGRFFTESPDKDPLPLAYYRHPSGSGWLLYSAGPNRVFEMDVAVIYDPMKPVPSEAMINVTYDPTNGTLSAGDLFRVKQ